MRFRRRAALILFVSISLIFSTAQLGAAAPYPGTTVNWMSIYITHAYYYDLDYDGIKDDVLVDFTCYVKDWIPSPSWSYYELFLRLPSGMTYLVTFEVYGKYRVLQLRMAWFNCATESGWYNIKIDSYAIFSNAIGYSTSNYDFDPPTQGGTGEPHVILYLL